jgi:hypothetical protein
MVSKLGILEKGFVPIKVMLLGIVTAVKLVQPEKVSELIVVKLFGIVTDVKLMQSINAPI